MFRYNPNNVHVQERRPTACSEAVGNDGALSGGDTAPPHRCLPAQVHRRSRRQLLPRHIRSLVVNRYVYM